MTRKWRFGLVLLVLSVTPVRSQSPYDRYLQAWRNIDQTKQTLSRLDTQIAGCRWTDFSRKKRLEEQRKGYKRTLRDESLLAAQSLREHMNSLPNLDDRSEMVLKSWYQIGKYYIDGGKCPNATPYLARCRTHPRFRSARVDGEPLHKMVRPLELSCRKSWLARVIGTIRITYSGKTAYIFKHHADALADSRPYSSYELERLGTRVFGVDEIAGAKKVVGELAGSQQILVKPPFLLVAGPGKYYDRISAMKIPSQERGYTLAQEEITRSLPAIYRDLISPAVRRLKREYFDQAAPQRLIPIYIVGGRLDEQGLEQYAQYCETIHFRSCGSRIGYYLEYDNSIMVWLATGGGTLIHELVHALMASDFPDAPGWLNEGIASMNEELGPNGVPLDNWRLAYAQALLQRFGRVIPIERLMGLSEADFEYGDLAPLHCAMARYFCLYLYEKHGVLPAVYKDIRHWPQVSPMAPIDIIRSHLRGQSVRNIQEDWQRWIAGRALPDKWYDVGRVMRDEVGQLKFDPWNPPVPD